jgi:hypothetical protein
MSLRQTVCRDAAYGTGEDFLSGVPPVRGGSPLREEAVRPQRTAKSKGKEIPLLAIFTSFDLTICRPSDVR